MSLSNSIKVSITRKVKGYITVEILNAEGHFTLHRVTLPYIKGHFTLQRVTLPQNEKH